MFSDWQLNIYKLGILELKFLFYLSIPKMIAQETLIVKVGKSKCGGTPHPTPPHSTYIVVNTQTYMKKMQYPKNNCIQNGNG